MPSIQLHGKIFLQGTINALTGLHIGGNSGELDIGGIDNPIIRNAFNRQPYIPGSSLRGKMRGLLDRHFENSLEKRVGRDVRVHECETPADYNGCPVCQIFGVAPIRQLRGKTMPTRLIVRDTFLTPESLASLDRADTDTDYTEIKTEVAIDRITSAATPRQQERVPAGAIFGPIQIVHSLYTRHGSDHDNQLQDELAYFDTVLKGMELLEDDYLGGSGSRGSGQVEFQHLTMTFKSRECYEKPKDVTPITIAENTDIKDLRQSDYIEKVLAAVRAE
ncbi:type III-A CRISPR-associated RAMP protein Csm3 [Candidatus Poribacteria bacterium]|nr:type III-A CRISPR-associated RAMP protein Csm3 [Candidatus Poribacteria bacterium]MYH82858.1 type III-A CRISPR-associated RAMP protein Csm3 [Candidatus Poribacteria bacterium]MYK94898.1 type III-A CRISPR-associated RAMP protein Csm3 [Candidatus Poribacteria bacterium]